jgi:hypothetical protein
LIVVFGASTGAAESSTWAPLSSLLPQGEQGSFQWSGGARSSTRAGLTRQGADAATSARAAAICRYRFTPVRSKAAAPAGPLPHRHDPAALGVTVRYMSAWERPGSTPRPGGNPDRGSFSTARRRPHFIVSYGAAQQRHPRMNSLRACARRGLPEENKGMASPNNSGSLTRTGGGRVPLEPAAPQPPQHRR